MTKSVILTEEEWDGLPHLLAKKLHEQMKRPWGFSLVSNESGEPIVDRLHDYLRGTMAIVMADAVQEMERRSSE
jgi:hypothetical protein